MRWDLGRPLYKVKGSAFHKGICMFPHLFLAKYAGTVKTAFTLVAKEASAVSFIFCKTIEEISSGCNFFLLTLSVDNHDGLVALPRFDFKSPEFDINLHRGICMHCAANEVHRNLCSLGQPDSWLHQLLSSPGQRRPSDSGRDPRHHSSIHPLTVALLYASEKKLVVFLAIN